MWTRSLKKVKIKMVDIFFNSIQFIYSCNKGLWPKVQIQFQVLTVSVIHGVQMLLIYISHLYSCYSLIDKIVLKMVEYNI